MPDAIDSREPKMYSNVNRFSNSVFFAIPVRAERLAECYEMKARGNVSPNWLDDDVAEIVTGLDPEDAQLATVETGRGGSGVAIGLEILSVVANVGGVVGLGVAAIQAIGAIARRLKSTKRGVISLSKGAAALLAANESLERHPGKNVRLAAFGALDVDTDSSYSEFDVYWAILEVGDGTVEFYIISDKAEVMLAGSVPRPPDPYSRN